MATQTFDPGDGLAPYRCGVSIVVFNDIGQVLGCTRVAAKNIDRFENPMQFPQGGIDIGEDEETAAYRELYEEVGLNRSQVKLLGRAPEYTFYDFPDFVKQNWETEGRAQKYRGQRHAWFAFLLTDADHVFSFDHHHEVEFEAADWVNFDAVVASVVPFKQEAYAKAAEMFGPIVAELQSRA